MMPSDREKFSKLTQCVAVEFCGRLRRNCGAILVDISILSALSDGHLRGRARPGLNLMSSDREKFSKSTHQCVAWETCCCLRSNCDAILIDNSSLSALSDGHVRGCAQSGITFDAHISGDAQ